MKIKLLLTTLLGLAISTAAFAEAPGDAPSPALKNAVILIIRHAEKPASGYELSPEGQLRAKAYVNYFENFTVAGRPLKLDHLFATADSKGSHRPRLTLEPLSKVLGLAIDTRFKDKDYRALADEIRTRPHGPAILIAWHHEEIPSLIRALGGDPSQIIPHSKWPSEVFGWLIELRYDAKGRLVETKLINEKLMPDDSEKTAGKP